MNQSQQDRDLRKQIESTVSVESGVSQSSLKPPALPRLLSTGQLSVGKPASSVPTMPSIRSVPLVPLSATSQTYTGMRSPPPIIRPPSLVTPLVQPGAMLTRQPTIDQLNQSFGSQQYVQSTLMSPVLQPVQYIIHHLCGHQFLILLLVSQDCVNIISWICGFESINS